MKNSIVYTAAILTSQQWFHTKQYNETAEANTIKLVADERKDIKKIILGDLVQYHSKMKIYKMKPHKNYINFETVQLIYFKPRRI